MKHLLSILCAALLLAACSDTPDVRVSKIWDNEYSSFPSIEKFNGKYYVSAREAKSHIFDEDGKAAGKARILVSKDGEKWESVALLEKEGYDLRDPKLSVTADGRLMVIMGGSMYVDRQLVRMDPQVSFSSDGINFSEPQNVKFEGMDGPVDREWIWRVTWNDGVGYGVTYGGPHFSLLKTEDGVTFSKVCDLRIDGKDEIVKYAGESTIRFAPDGRMYMMVRSRDSHWGWSDYPYTEWTWTEMNINLGGPDFIFMKDGSLYAGTRYYFSNGNCKTMLMRGCSEGKFDELYLLPSGGDTSYPGFMETDDELWMVYYSCHETNDTFKESTSYEFDPAKRTPRACIYLAKFDKDFLSGYSAAADN